MVDFPSHFFREYSKCDCPNNKNVLAHFGNVLNPHMEPFTTHAALAIWSNYKWYRLHYTNNKKWKFKYFLPFDTNKGMRWKINKLQEDGLLAT